MNGHLITNLIIYLYYIMESNIFEIVKKEKKNINYINLQNVNKLFCKYFFKYIVDIKNNFEEIDDYTFRNNITKISNMIFNIFWIIFLVSFNIHITIFFVERASLLFIEYIKLSIEKNDESENLINQSILFTYDKTIGDTSLEKIMEENKKQENLNQVKYKKILKIRDNTYIFVKILDNILVKNNSDIEKYKKNNKYIINNLFHIYQNNNNTEKIDKYLFFKINKILNDYTTDKGLFIIRIVIEIIYEISDIDIENIGFFLNILDNTLEYYETNNLFDNISFGTKDIHNKKIYNEIKENIYRFIN